MMGGRERDGWKSRVADQSNTAAELARVRARLAELDAERLQLQGELEAIRARQASELSAEAKRPEFENAPVTNYSSSREKVDLFRSMFAGRPDVFPVRWENSKSGRAGYSPACFNEWVKGICGKPTVKCGECQHQRFIPPDAGVMERHLRGGDVRTPDFVAGVYPLLQDNTCWFLAADFDKASWAEDASAMLETCRAKRVPAALERSRSGNGGMSGYSLPNRYRPVPRATRISADHGNDGEATRDRLRLL